MDHAVMEYVYVRMVGQEWIVSRGNVSQDVMKKVFVRMVLAYVIKDGMEKIVTYVSLFIFCCYKNRSLLLYYGIPYRSLSQGGGESG